MRLKNIAHIGAGHPFRGKIPEVTGSSVIAVQMKDVELPDVINWSSCTTTELNSKRNPEFLACGDILVAARGNRNYAVLIDKTLASSGRVAVAAPHFFIVRLKVERLEGEDILPEFIVWLLNQPPTQRYFEKNSEGTLTKSIRRSVLEEVPVMIPHLKKQRSIVSLAGVFRQEQRLIEQLTINNERIMNAIADELYN